MRSQLFRAIRENFQPINEPGYTAVSFQVSGTVGRPKTNLMDKLIGRDLKDLSSVISGLIGGGKSDAQKKEGGRGSCRRTPTPVSAAPPAADAAPDSDALRPSPSAHAMRVIAGAAGGIRLDVPKSEVRPDHGPRESRDLLQPRAKRSSARMFSIFSPAPARLGSKRSVAARLPRFLWKRIRRPWRPSSAISPGRN